MIFKTSALSLDLKNPFRIAHGISSTRTNALISFESSVKSDRVSIYGEAALPPYYGISSEDIADWIRSIGELDIPDADFFSPATILSAIPEGPLPGLAAVDMAVLDLWGRRLGHPLYRLFGLNPANTPASALTPLHPRVSRRFRQSLGRRKGRTVSKAETGYR